MTAVATDMTSTRPSRWTMPALVGSLALLSAPVFIPVLPDIIARVGGTPAVVRLVWLHPFAAVLALTDFAAFVSVGGWTRERLYTLACGAVVGSCDRRCRAYRRA